LKQAKSDLVRGGKAGSLLQPSVSWAGSRLKLLGGDPGQGQRFEPERIAVIEAEVRHDVNCLPSRNVNEHVGDSGPIIHVGMHSSDVLEHWPGPAADRPSV